MSSPNYVIDMLTRLNLIENFAKETGYNVYRLYKIFCKPPFDKYNYHTFDVFKRVLKNDSNCIDVGANKGYILKKIIKISPNGQHFAFEPIPDLYKKLKTKLGKKATIFNCALSNVNEETKFYYFKKRPAVSGLKKRCLDKEYGCITIKVVTELLDNLITSNTKIDLIKIDVEGAEYLVLDGARSIIKKYKPFLLFEFGYGGGNIYDTTPEMIFDFMEEMGMELNLLSYFLTNRAPLTKEEFRGQYYKGYNCFFIAYDPGKIS